MSDFPKWLVPHESHGLHDLAKTFEAHTDRVSGVTKFLVHSAEDEAHLLAAHEEPKEHKEEA
jgi:hypothetical protein